MLADLEHFYVLTGDKNTSNLAGTRFFLLEPSL